MTCIRNTVDSLQFEPHWKKKKKERPKKVSVAQCFISQKNEHPGKRVISYFPHISRAQAAAKCYCSLCLIGCQKEKSKLSIMFNYKYSQIHPCFQSVSIKIDLMLPPVGHLQTETSKINLHIRNCSQHILQPILYLLPNINQRR